MSRTTQTAHLDPVFGAVCFLLLGIIAVDEETALRAEMVDEGGGICCSQQGLGLSRQPWQVVHFRRRHETYYTSIKRQLGYKKARNASPGRDPERYTRSSTSSQTRQS